MGPHASTRSRRRNRRCSGREQHPNDPRRAPADRPRSAPQLARSRAQLFVLQALAGGRATSLNELAERTHTDQSSVSVVVRRLADRKLVARKASRLDARRVELTLTPAGRRMLARCPEPTPARLLAAIPPLPAPPPPGPEPGPPG